MPERKVASNGDLTRNPSGHESDTLTTEPPRQGSRLLNEYEYVDCIKGMSVFGFSQRYAPFI